MLFRPMVSTERRQRRAAMGDRSCSIRRIRERAGMTGIMKGWVDEIGPQVAALIRSKPELMDEMLQDPTSFVRRELGVQLPFIAQVYEKDGVFCVAPTGLTAGNESDELHD